MRKLRAKVSERPTGFVWVEKGVLAGSGFPASRSQLKWLRSQGITTILTLTEKPIPEEWIKGMDLEVHHIPMKDHLPPEGARLSEAAEFVKKSLGKEKVVLVHCLAGEGRTGCALAAYVMVRKKETAKEAIEDLRQIKPQFIEKGQEAALYDMEKVTGGVSKGQAESG